MKSLPRVLENDSVRCPTQIVVGAGPAAIADHVIDAAIGIVGPIYGNTGYTRSRIAWAQEKRNGLSERIHKERVRNLGIKRAAEGWLGVVEHIVNVGLLDKGKQSSLDRKIDIDGSLHWKLSVGRFIAVHRERKLTNIIAALHSSGCLTGRLNRWQQKPDENSDDCDDHE